MKVVRIMQQKFILICTKIVYVVSILPRKLIYYLLIYYQSINAMYQYIVIPVLHVAQYL